MQERTHKLPVRKTDRQIEATLLHPRFELPCQRGTEPNRAGYIWSLPLGQELCTAGAQLAQVCTCLPAWLPLLGWGRPGNPLPVPCNIGEFYILLPSAGTAEQKLPWEQWPHCEATGRSCLSYLLSDLVAGCIAAFSGMVASTLAQSTPSWHGSNAHLGYGS